MVPAEDPPETELTLPLHAEEVVVSRREIAGDTVRVSTVTREKPKLIEAQLLRERVEIERVPIDQPIDSAPEVRQDGDTTIISVVEEVIVVQRRLMLKEEIRIRRVRTTEDHRETVQVREQDALITRIEAKPDATGDASDSPGAVPIISK